MRPAEVPGLPAGVGEHFEAEGIEELYPPQVAAVEAGVTEGDSVVAAVPTASGKTMIAELAMLSTVLGDGGDGTTAGAADAIDSPSGAATTAAAENASADAGTALYIVPLRALAGEKAGEFERFGRRDGAPRAGRRRRVPTEFPHATTPTGRFASGGAAVAWQTRRGITHASGSGPRRRRRVRPPRRSVSRA